ncbi:MAG: glycosyltransferase [Cyanothece sp. SIO1E1]|nr:glycosyltransferase [Cyanothece sp. SIO1E1]
MSKTNSLSRFNFPTQDILIDVMSKREKLVFLGLVSIWGIALLTLWVWWFQSEHIVSWGGTLITSLVLAWQTVLPAYYFYFVAKMKRPNPAIAIPDDWQVAIVVTKAPSEPWPIVQKTLEAMLAQAYPHDNWLADEDPQPETIAWCEAHSVKISTRKGIEIYHRSSWPRRTKCKEGNLAYFYDMVGYTHYDFVVQLDADHVPEPGYLEAMIRPFVNPAVGYVAAPSICDANADESWVVNARAFVEATMHGSLQAGYNDGWAPLCIGSHYAVRTLAVNDIGGLGPELAEDHSTTLMMNAHGWSGVFAFDAEAHGDGPACFSDFLTQEFQWSRSLTALLLSVTPRYWSGLKPHLKFQFLFAQLWYPLYALSFLIGFSLPILALLRDAAWVNVSYLEFLGRNFLVTLACVVPVLWIARKGWLRPQNAKVVSWETLLFPLARWPWILAGVCNAFVSWALQKELPFKVTPKGTNAPKPLPLNALFPYLGLGMLSAIAVIAIKNVSQAPGYYFLTLLNSMVYVVLCAAIIWTHIRENVCNSSRYMQQKFALLCAFGCFITATGMKVQETFGGLTRNQNSSVNQTALKTAP